MTFEPTPLEGLYLLQPKVFGDERGFFLESWNAETFRAAGFDLDFVQDNHSRSARGILRGLHFQYKCSDYYHPASEVSLAWDDPTVDIAWPLPAGEQPRLSAKDAAGLAWADLPLFD